MGAALPIVVAGASLASTGMSAYGQLQSGKANAAGSAYQAEKARQAAEYARLQADQTDVQMREELRTTLANIDAIRASAGTNPDAPTAVAIRANETRVSERERGIRTLSLRQQANQYDADAQFYRQAAKAQLRAGYIGAAGVAFGGIARGIGGFSGSSFDGGGGGGSFGANTGWASPSQRA